MSDETPDPLLPIFQRLHTDTLLLRRAVIFLLGATISPDTLSKFVEALGVPVAGDTPEATKVLHEAIDTFRCELEEHIRVPKD